MTATERLRQLLDERGVEYETYHDAALTEVDAVFWQDRNGQPCSAIGNADDIPEGMLSVQCIISPEQAVEATLGRGTCKWEPADFITEGEWGDKLLTEADNARLRAENAKLRELVAEIWPTAEYAGYEHELSRARELMRELGYEEDE